MGKLFKPASLLLYFLAAILFFVIGLLIAKLVGAGKGQMLAGGAIVLFYGIVSSGLSVLAAALVAFMAPHKTVVLINKVAGILVGLLVAFGVYNWLTREPAIQPDVEYPRKPTAPASEGEPHFKLQAEYLELSDIQSLAHCRSPFGDYTTEVRSHADGSCFFEQRFPDREAPFTVRLDASGAGYLLDSGAVADTLAPADVEMIRGHELHKMTTNPEFFFTDIRFQESVEYLGSKHDRFAARDGLGHPVYLLNDPDRQRISKIGLLNPRDTTETIELLFDSWIPGEFGDLLQEARIVQAGRDTFYFGFRELSITLKNGSTEKINMP